MQKMTFLFARFASEIQVTSSAKAKVAAREWAKNEIRKRSSSESARGNKLKISTHLGQGGGSVGFTVEHSAGVATKSNNSIIFMSPKGTNFRVKKNSITVAG
jgi:hypothetical protein